MNPLTSPASSLFLPLSQLSPHSNRLSHSLHDGRTSQKERILLEQTLWNEVKKLRALNDTSIFSYLIGYYHTILYQVPKLQAQDDLFHYHVLIRLGDLNRYMERTDVAEYFYCNARNLFPFFGHAYNQLGLLTKPTNCYKCCYYYARAAKSSDRPLNTIADSNLRIAVSKYNCEILNHILNDDACISSDDKTDHNKFPSTAFEWFYVIVVAIYADNVQPITKMFLCYMNENFSTQKAAIVYDNVKTTTVYCDRESYTLLASLDILLDWLKLGSQGEAICNTVSAELRQVRSCLQTILASCGQGIDTSRLSNSSCNTTFSTTTIDINSTKISAHLSNSSSTLQDSTYTSGTDSSKSSSSNKLPALPHDYVLRGFSPLDNVHRDLTFEIRIRARGNSLEGNNRGGGICGNINGSHTSHNQKFIDTGQLVQIVLRIKSKMEGFRHLIKRRQTRNIALESILSNLDKNHST